MSRVWELQDISATQKLVLLALADWANDEGLCWPSINRLAVKTGATSRSVQRLIRQLEELGLVKREEVVGKGNRYWIALPMTECHPRHSVTPPLTEVHPTPDTVSPNTSYTHQDTPNDMSSDDDLTVNDVVEAWNDLAVDRGLPKVSKVTEARRRQVQARIKEYPDAGDWSKALSAIDKSKFLCGDNDRGWRANFDFLLQPSTFIKLLEGTYDR
jgi:DNA-binding Lrp family transcriptional regulator